MTDAPCLTTYPTPAEIPDESWSLDRLSSFCGLICRRQAADAWLIGRALVAVRAKLDHGRWLPWVKEHCPGISRGTANRYMLLAERMALDEVRGSSLTECYRRAGMVATPATAPPAATPPPLPTGRPACRRPTTRQESGWPSWAVRDPFRVVTPAAEAPTEPGEEADSVGEGDTQAAADTFREEWEVRLPHLLEVLDDTLGWLLARWDELGPCVQADRHARPIASLLGKLSALADRASRPAASPPAHRPSGDPVAGLAA